MNEAIIDPTGIAQRYIEIWNETDPARRRGLIAALWAEDASYVDPLMQGEGREQIDGLVAAVHARFPGHVFTLDGQPDGHNGRLRFSWTLGEADLAPVVRGSDFAVLDSDRRLRSVTGFLDQVPG